MQTATPKTWTKELIETAIADFVERNNRYPSTDELRNGNGLPSRLIFDRVMGESLVAYGDEHYPELIQKSRQTKYFEVILNGKRTNPLTWLDADYTLATGKEYQFNKGEHSVVVPAADTTTDTAAQKLQIPTIGPMSKGDYDTLLKTAADNGSAPTLYTVTMQAMSTAAASALQQKADALGVHYTSKWVED